MTSASIEMSKVCFDRIIDHVSVTWPRGRVVGVVGPNGAGKSTLLHLAAGIWRPNSGDVRLNGIPVSRMSERDRARALAYLPQHWPENIHYTVQEYVEMGRYPYRTSFGNLTRESREAVTSAIHALDLTRYQDVPMHRLSGGEQQRAGIARCIAQGSSVIVLDEPISNLDLYFQVDILERLQSLAKDGFLIVLAIHNLELAARYCTDLLLLHKGAVWSSGSPHTVLTEETLAKVFRIQAKTYADPYVGHLRLTHIT